MQIHFKVFFWNDDLNTEQAIFHFLIFCEKCPETITFLAQVPKSCIHFNIVSLLLWLEYCIAVFTIIFHFHTLKINERAETEIPTNSLCPCSP